ncbi:MAG: 1-acyl-sn-glycerol-3-phosphate acyltransferase [Isosphaeraceae bacterium]
MQNIILDKPYSFVPPDRRTFWPAVFRPVMRPYLSKAWGVTSIDFDGVDRLKGALRERASVVLAPNHCRPCDPMVISLLGTEAGTPLYTMASWHLFMGNRFTAWLLTRIGGFSVYREGLDRTAVKAAIELLVEARRPLVIFPEGYISRANDRLGAFNEGPAFIARSAAKQRTKVEPGAQTLLVPVALRYRFLGRLDASAAPVLDRIETRLTWKPRPDLPLVERLQRAGRAILGLKEFELFGEVRQGEIHARLGRLIDDILVPMEDEWKVKKREGDVPSRVRGLRTAILPELVEGDLAESERDRRWDLLARLYLVQQLALYPSGYLDGNVITERVLETVERLEEDLTDVATIHRPLAVTVHVGEPVEVKPEDRDLPGLMHEVRFRIETMLGVARSQDTMPERSERENT